jgi:hypothetical protein
MTWRIRPDRFIWLGLQIKKGSIFLNLFYSKHPDKKTDEQLEILLQNMDSVPHRLASVSRYIKTVVGVPEFSAFLKSQIPSLSFSGEKIEEMYGKYGPEK